MDTNSFNNLKKYYFPNTLTPYYRHSRGTLIVYLRYSNGLKYYADYICNHCENIFTWEVCDVCSQNIFDFISLIQKLDGKLCKCNNKFNHKIDIKRIDYALMLSGGVNIVFHYKISINNKDVQIHMRSNNNKTFYTETITALPIDMSSKLIEKKNKIDKKIPQINDFIDNIMSSFRELRNYMKPFCTLTTHEVESKLPNDMKKSDFTTSSKISDISKKSEIKSTPTMALNKSQYYIGEMEHRGGRCFCNIWELESIGSDVTIKCVQCSVRVSFNSRLFKENFVPFDKSEDYTVKPVDVIVLSNTNMCKSRHHSVKDVVGIVGTKANNRITQAYIPLSYCRNCRRYTMLESDYNRLHGKPDCTVQNKNGRIICTPYSDEPELDANSIFKKYGYTTSSQSGLLPSERQDILKKIIENRELTCRQVIEHLEFLIRYNGKKANMNSAVHKWQSDFEFVRNYHLKMEEKVVVGNIIK